MKKRGKSKEIWLAFEWPGVHLHMGYPPAKAWWYDFPRYGARLSKMAVTYSRGTMSYYVIQKEYEENGRKFFERVKKNPAVMFDVLRKANQAAEKIFGLEKKFRSFDFGKLSDRKLIDLQKELFYWDEILWRKGQIQNLLEMHNNYLSTYIRELIVETFGSEKTARYFQALSAGEYESKAERQDLDFAKLAKKTKKSNEIEKIIRSHARKYTWMLYGWMGPALDEKYFQENFLITSKNKGFLLEIEKRDKERRENVKKRERILKKFSERDKKLAILLRELLDAKARRVDAHSLTYYLGDQIHGEMGRRNFVTLDQLRAVPPKKIPDIFKKVDPHQLNAEYDYVMYWFEKGKVKKIVGKKGRKKFEYISARLPKVKKTNLIKGEMAYMGHARGKARVILEPADFGKFQKGEVLVTRMTDPSYVPLMKISKAVVTDIGGITCHAAIVSRELKIPCVIGTKIGTKIIRDGNLLKIEADKGVVKIIKKK